MEERRIRWMDGSEDTTLPGMLLSDNLEFFGESIPTEATYRYLTPLLSITDGEQDIPELRGKRMQDGRLIRRFRKEPAMADKVLAMEWDFNRTCIFNEIDLYCGAAPQAVEITAIDGEPEVWFSGAVSGANGLYRIKLDGRSAQKLRVTLTAEGRCNGTIAFAPMGEGGFGYDPVFFVPEKAKTFGQLTAEEKAEISHRGKALTAFAKKLETYLKESSSN